MMSQKWFGNNHLFRITSHLRNNYYHHKLFLGAIPCKMLQGARFVVAFVFFYVCIGQLIADPIHQTQNQDDFKQKEVDRYEY